MAHPAQEFIDNALNQLGEKYKFGAEVPDGQDGKEWDSGELVEWAVNKAGGPTTPVTTPDGGEHSKVMPDGTWRQYRLLHDGGNDIDPKTALSSPGALLFKFSSDPLVPGQIPNERQAYISIGNGRVLEVHPEGGVRVINANPEDFTHAATVPAFKLSATEAVELGNHIDERLGQVAQAEADAEAQATGQPAAGETQATPTAEQPTTRTSTPAKDDDDGDAAPEAPAAPATPKTAADAVALSKKAIDLRQNVEDLRESEQKYAKEKVNLEAKAKVAHTEAEAKRLAGDDAGATASTAQAETFELDAQNAETSRKVFGETADERTAEAAKLDAEANSIAVELAPKVGFSDPEWVIPDKLPPAPGPNATEAEVRAYAQARDAVLKQRDSAATDWGHGEQRLDDIAESRRLIAAEADGKAAIGRARIQAESENIKALDERLTEVDSNRKRYEREAAEERREFDALTQRGDTQGAALAHARAQQLDAHKDSWDKQWGELANRRGMASFRIGQESENVAEYEQIAKNVRAQAAETAKVADDFGKSANEYEASADQLDTSNDVLQDVLGRDLPADTRVNIPGEDGMDVTVPADRATPASPAPPTSGVSTSPGAETSGVSTSPGAPVSDATPVDDGIGTEIASIDVAADSLMSDPEPQEDFVSLNPEPTEEPLVDDSVSAGGLDDGIA